MKRVLLLCLMFLAVILAASAGPVHAAYTWAAQGTASDGRPDNGLVTFNFTSLTSLSITLQNTAGPSQLGGISSVLDGLTFSLSGAPTGITLTGAQAFGTVDATNGLAFNSPSGGSPDRLNTIRLEYAIAGWHITVVRRKRVFQTLRHRKQ